VSADFGGWDEARAVVLQTDGRIVVVGYVQSVLGSSADFGLVRYVENGLPDASFGTGGRVTTDFSGGPDEADAAALQPDGMIVVAGSTLPAGAAYPHMALARYRADGSLDSTFGDGGKVTTDFGNGAWARAALVQADGKVVVAGSRALEGFALARYERDGKLDPTFGLGGKVTTDFDSASFEFALAALLQPDGKILAVGRAGDDFGLARYNPDGTLDPTFGTSGKVTTHFGGTEVAWATALQPDGKIVVTGVTSSGDGDFAVARYNPDGGLDATFGVAGRATTNFGAFDLASAVVLEPDGRIVAIGTSGSSQCALARYGRDGSLDSTFGSGGKVISPSMGTAYAAVRQPDGKIIVAGGGSNFLVARYLNDGGATEFANINALVTMEPSDRGTDRITMLSTFKLGSRSNGIDPATEPSRIQIGAISLMLPRGSLNRSFFGWTYHGRVDDATWTVWLRQLSPARYMLSATAQGLELVRPIRGIDVSVTIGDDTGTVNVEPFVLGPM
jgi:uncharacterized delta-60 repeat protein